MTAIINNNIIVVVWYYGSIILLLLLFNVCPVIDSAVCHATSFWSNAHQEYRPSVEIENRFEARSRSPLSGKLSRIRPSLLCRTRPTTTEEVSCDGFCSHFDSARTSSGDLRSRVGDACQTPETVRRTKRRKRSIVKTS